MHLKYFIQIQVTPVSIQWYEMHIHEIYTIFPCPLSVFGWL